MYATFFGFGGIGERACVLSREVTQIKRKLSPREKAFCGFFADTGDAAASAKKAGFRTDGSQRGDRLLSDGAIVEEINRLLSQKRGVLARLAAIGYQRLAFGSIADALRLLYMGEPEAKQLSEMDLFLISEIKRNKDGMLEIKFFDRMKALEKLENAAREDCGGVSGLMEAIGIGAGAVNGDDA